MIHLILDVPSRCNFLSRKEQEEQEEQIVNEDDEKEEITLKIQMSTLTSPISRDEIISKFQLPEDSILKLYFEGKMIPWSMVEQCDRVEIRVCQPHKNVKPNISEGTSCSDLVRQKVKELEIRLSSLENEADPAKISAKTERDLTVLTKQITFLGRRLQEADQAEWIKKS